MVPVGNGYPSRDKCWGVTKEEGQKGKRAKDRMVGFRKEVAMKPYLSQRVKNRRGGKPRRKLLIKKQVQKEKFGIQKL